MRRPGSLTPGWSRTTWPAETPRIATWLWPGPKALLPKLEILQGLVPFNVAYLGEGHWHKGVSGDLFIEDVPAAKALAERIGESVWFTQLLRPGPGSFFAFDPGLAHYAHVEEETVVQLSSTGPWTITYINPSDDPRK